MVWQRAIDLTVDVYRTTRNFPAEERYRLTDQLCRAATSIPANIAEADGRYSRADQIRFLHIARGSAFEVQTYLLLASRLGYLDLVKADNLEKRYVEVTMLLNGLIRQKRNAG